MKGIVFLFSISFLLNSCFMSKTVRLAKRGEINKTDFVQEIPFLYYKNLILVDVTIGDKTYKFLYDTGAFMSVVNASIVNDFEHTEISKHQVRSSSGEKRKKQYIEIPSIKIDDLEFTETGAIVQDLSGINSMLGCHKIDGIIGNSVLKFAAWQIDYDEHSLTVANDIKKLQTSSEPISVGDKGWGVKRIKLTIDGDERSYIFDTGFNNFIQSNNYLKENLEKKNGEVKAVSISGELSADLFGKNKSETFYIKVDSIQFAENTITEQIVYTKTNGSSLIGNRFSEHFLITYDWKNGHIYFDPKEAFEKDSLFVFNELVIPDYEALKLKIVARWEKDSSALTIGDYIESINQLDVSHFTLDEFCDFLEEEWKEIKKEREITILVKGKEYVLEKKVLLN